MARLVQGCAAALLTPQVLAIIRVACPDPGQRARAFGLMGAVQALASVLGQVLGGAVTQADLLGLGWRPVFLINVPIGIAALLLTPYAVPESRAPDADRIDWAGSALGAVGLGALLMLLIEGERIGPPVRRVGLLALAVVALAAFVATQVRRTRRDDAPLLHTGLFGDRAFAGGSALILLFAATMPPLYLGYTLLLQDGLGASPLRAGLFFAPLALSVAVASYATGRLGRRFGARAVLLTGALLHTTGGCLALLLCLAAPRGAPGNLLPALVILGVGEGFFVTPSLNAVLGTVADRHIGGASGLLSAVQRLGNALGMAVLMLPFLAVHARARAAGAPQEKGYTEAFAALCGAVAALSLLTAVLLWHLPLGRPAPRRTPVPRVEPRPDEA
ncbi:MFS transporter [Streptomyces sp. NBC_01525]|uniref:MFS transporter n=1 Tax=Streptomyces sp. NBC_01525 TaxID=2903893 RepID=UPI0038676648